ncbi:biopolymer transporter ExbD [Kamptonema cortianum]|nr:biopolymer transporter ExbD [Oscillatoria laete-virens]MDK3159632.1 biopolymer transporter ExbD [Kamptonema cortianum]MDL5050281.1 biopolymer transporter ExbD [Oscillatoria amoena NRMC-F 0135]MDL5055115.1 biopolymer transporter ExbD [Oscillatoria laete-virens NRMC-F 0139]
MSESDHSSHSKRRHKRHKEELFKPEDIEFQVAPMIDVLLVLLTFFMTISSADEIVKFSGEEIKLPDVLYAKDKDKKALEVVINASWDEGANMGSLAVDGGQSFTEPSRITELISQRYEALSPENKSRFRVLVRASRDVRYSFIQDIMRAAARAKVVNITYSVVSGSVEEEGGGTPPPTP